MKSRRLQNTTRPPARSGEREREPLGVPERPTRMRAKSRNGAASISPLLRSREIYETWPRPVRAAIWIVLGIAAWAVVIYLISLLL